MGQKTSSRRAGRRQFQKSMDSLGERFTQAIQRLPPNTSTAVISGAVMILGLFLIFHWDAEELKAAYALTVLGFVGVAWYLWSQRHLLFHRRKSHRSHRR